jgi:hypothetical protein
VTLSTAHKLGKVSPANRFTVFSPYSASAPDHPCFSDDQIAEVTVVIALDLKLNAPILQVHLHSKFLPLPVGMG